MLFDLEAEQCVIGAALLSRSATETMLGMLGAYDFGAPHHATIFDAIASLYRQGAAVDSKTVLDELVTQGTTWPQAQSDLVLLLANVPAISSAPRYCEIVSRYALRRRIAAEATELANGAKDPTVDPGELLDAHRVRLADIDSPIMANDPDDLELDEFLARPIEQRAPWAVPGLLRVGHRVIVTAPEGAGKSTLLRQLGVLPAFGVHPLTFDAIEPTPTLVVDLENPVDVVHLAVRHLVAQAERQSSERAPASLWLRPGGIDLRTRRDRVAFEAVLRRRRPELVSLGPIYKAYSRKASESDELVASEIQAVLDDLRTRFAFALVAEHHSPKASNGHRDLGPFGSSLWLRWPEVGIKLVPGTGDKRGVLTIGRWRGDRTTTAWPDELHRSDIWPWCGWWRKGLEQDEATS
jgi:replicative DNA helicase